mgnify:CR=1 FL=1
MQAAGCALLAIRSEFEVECIPPSRENLAAGFFLEQYTHAENKNIFIVFNRIF